jgi:GNAT superfamily N-acetyltransferase
VWSALGLVVKTGEMGLTIRPGRSSDASDVAAAHVAAWQVAYRGLVPDDFLDSPIFATSRHDGWHRMLGGELPNGWDPDHQVLVPEVDGTVVGFSHVGRERMDDQADPNGVVLGVEGELYGFYVHPDYWGSGVATALVDASNEWLDDRFSTACLWVLRDNPRARRFYERQGWTAHDSTDVQYWEGPTIPGLALLEPLAELRYVR